MKRIWGGRRLEMQFGKAIAPQECTSANRGRLSTVSKRKVLRGMAQCVAGRCTNFGHKIDRRFPEMCRIHLAFCYLQIHCAGKTFLAVHPPSKSTLVCAAALLGNSLKLWWETGDTAGLVHRIPVKSGDAIFLPSGRLHTMGDGILIAEIQQNNDTIYRVFDWNRHERASLLAG